jgi:putative SOS response-associated peptidase YedK
MSQIHTRMPCVLETEVLLAWMNPDEQDAKAVMHLLRPAADGVLEIKPTGLSQTESSSSDHGLWGR